jgi:hypothetical protein
MSKVFSIKRGDTLPKVKGQLFNDSANTSPVDLTTADTVKFKMTPASQSGTMTVDRDVLVTNATEGRWEIQLTAIETSEQGQYEAEIEVAWDDQRTNVTTYPKEDFINVTIYRDLDGLGS